MRNIKFISIFAACGFVLSFVFGLFSHSSFLIILLRALICCAVFAGLGILISLLFNNFLDDSSSSDFGSDDFDNSSKSADDSPKLGQLVDVVIEDEDLAPSESDNHFLVGDNHQMLKKSDISEKSNNAVEKNKEFVPLREHESVDNFSSKEPLSPEEVGLSASSDDGDEVEQEEGIDTLPDMESMVFTEDNDSGEEESNSYGDSDFGSSAGTYKKSSESVPDVKDAALMAKAISTALSEDDS